MVWSKRKKIGPYRITGELGQGGMGEVYEAYHELLERPVAIKRLLDDAAAKEELVERFVREGKALAQLQHQSIVAVYDMVETRTDLYMVLEYVDGFDMGHILQDGCLPPDITAILGLHLAQALEHAHYHGIIHRDIKPTNCMISAAGGVKLMDFGIARDLDLAGLTNTGFLVGTPMYMAPEVVAGNPADERSDIYALGGLLYQCLSGRRLFEGATQNSIFHRILEAKYPNLRKIARSVPGALQRIVHRCLSKKPERRYQSCAELRQALQSFLISHGGMSNHAARLVSFLLARQYITQEEALTRVDAATLESAAAIRLREGFRWAPWLGATALAMALAAWFWLGETPGVVDGIRSLMPVFFAGD